MKYSILLAVLLLLGCRIECYPGRETVYHDRCISIYEHNYGEKWVAKRMGFIEKTCTAHQAEWNTYIADTCPPPGTNLTWIDGPPWEPTDLPFIPAAPGTVKDE